MCVCVWGGGGGGQFFCGEFRGSSGAHAGACWRMLVLPEASANSVRGTRATAASILSRTYVNKSSGLQILQLPVQSPDDGYRDVCKHSPSLI